MLAPFFRLTVRIHCLFGLSKLSQGCLPCGIYIAWILERSVRALARVSVFGSQDILLRSMRYCSPPRPADSRLNLSRRVSAPFSLAGIALRLCSTPPSRLIACVSCSVAFLKAVAVIPPVSDRNHNQKDPAITESKGERRWSRLPGADSFPNKGAPPRTHCLSEFGGLLPDRGQ